MFYTCMPSFLAVKSDAGSRPMGLFKVHVRKTSYKGLLPEKERESSDF